MIVNQITTLTMPFQVTSIQGVPTASTNPITALKEIQFTGANTTVVKPLVFWPAGVTMQLNGELKSQTVFVKPNPIYEPDQLLLYKDISSVQDLKPIPPFGIVERSELFALESESQLALDLFNALRNIVTQRINYDTYGSSDLGHSLRALKQMQKYLHQFGLSSIPRYVMPLTSYDTEKFLNTGVLGTRLDSAVIADLQSVEDIASRVRGRLQEKGEGLYLSMVDTVDQVIDNKDPRFELLKSCALSLVALVRLDR